MGKVVFITLALLNHIVLRALIKWGLHQSKPPWNSHRKPIMLKIDRLYEQLLNSILQSDESNLVLRCQNKAKRECTMVQGKGKIHAQAKGKTRNKGGHWKQAKKLVRKFTLSCCIWDFNWLPSLLVTEQAITGLVTPQARPSACLEGTKTYGTFWHQGKVKIKFRDSSICRWHFKI